jgi:hypothetical protein
MNFRGGDSERFTKSESKSTFDAIAWGPAGRNVSAQGSSWDVQGVASVIFTRNGDGQSQDIREFRWPLYEYSGRKITASLGNATVRGEKRWKGQGGSAMANSLSMYSITENIHYSQLSSVALLLQPEPVFTSYSTRKALASLSHVLSTCGLPLPPTCLLVTVNAARSYFASTIRGGREGGEETAHKEYCPPLPSSSSLPLLLWSIPNTVVSCNDVRFQVLTEASMKFIVFWDVALCSHIEVYWRFRGMETVSTSETSVNFNVTIRCYIPEDSKLHLATIVILKLLVRLRKPIAVCLRIVGNNLQHDTAPQPRRS